jgi:hypothetical protein
MDLNDTTRRRSYGRGVPSGRYLVTGCAQRAEPFAQAWPTGTNHHQRVRPAGHENIEDLGKSEQLAAYLVHVVAAL